MSFGLIGGQDDANDVSPSGKLMLKYGSGWIIRGAQTGPIGSNEETRSGEKENCAGDEVVTGSINESSVEIVRWQEYRRNKLDSELKEWVMKGSSLEEVIGRQI